MSKETIYVDQDDEITAVISKIESSREKVVAVVLPAHSTVFTSAINMKLIKKAQDKHKKSIVLITSNVHILPVAAAAGLHTAKNLASKPTLPKVAVATANTDLPIQLDDSDASSVGLASAIATDADSDIIQLDNTVKEPKQKGVPFNKKLKVPNFNTFRIKVFAGSFLLVAVIIFWIFAAFVLPKATVTIKTDVSTIDSVLAVQATTEVKTFDVSKLILPATMLDNKKTDTEKAPATGKKDVGTKASGSMVITNCTDATVTVPAGTSFTNSGYSFALDAAVNVPGSNFFSAQNGGACKKDGKANGTVTAMKAGGDSNLTAGQNYVSSFASTVTGVGGAMGGGTSKIIVVLSAQDIEAAKARLAGKSKTAASSELITQLEASGLVALPETLTESAPAITASAAPDAEVTEVTVTQVISYTMLAVSKTDIQSLVEADVKTKISDNQLKILDNGIDKKQLQITSKTSPSDQKLQITTVATVGPDIDIVGVANDVAGKSRGDIQTMLSQRSGVKEVVVRYDPFWVTKTPKKASKIIVVVEQVNAK